MNTEDIREEIDAFDNECPCMHHVQLRQNGHNEPDMDAYKLGHPQPCNDGACQSKLRILRAASVHYP